VKVLYNYLGHHFVYSNYMNILHVSMTPGTTYGGAWDGWYGPSGREDPLVHKYDLYHVMASQAGRAMARAGRALTPNIIQALRNEAEVVCDSVSLYMRTGRAECKPLIAPCLFNIRNDPCEQNNLADM
jgi:hypothetical protein